MLLPSFDTVVSTVFTTVVPFGFLTQVHLISAYSLPNAHPGNGSQEDLLLTLRSHAYAFCYIVRPALYSGP